MAKLKRIGVNDSTLRNSLQRGAALTRRQRISIARALEQAGVDEIEAGIPEMGEESISEVEEIASVLKTAKPISWCELNRAAVDAAHRSGVERIHLSVPLSDLLIREQLRTDRGQILTRIKDVVSYAVDKELQVSLGGEDSSRADSSFILAAIEAATRAGAHRFRYVDTFGISEPYAIYDIFRTLRREVDLELEFHGHDDLGLATANTVAAVRGGATHVSVSILNVGERSSCAPMEEVVAGIKRFSLGTYRVRLSKLRDLAALVAGCLHLSLRTAKQANSEPGLSRATVKDADSTLEGSPQGDSHWPALIDQSTKIVLGHRSELSSIARILRSANCQPNKRQLRMLLSAVRERTLDLNRFVSVEELLALYTEMYPSPEALPHSSARKERL